MCLLLERVQVCGPSCHGATMTVCVSVHAGTGVLGMAGLNCSELIAQAAILCAAHGFAGAAPRQHPLLCWCVAILLFQAVHGAMAACTAATVVSGSREKGVAAGVQQCTAVLPGDVRGCVPDLASSTVCVLHMAV